MSDSFDDWEIVSRRTNKRWLKLFAMIFGSLLFWDNTGIHSSVIWVLRNRTTGDTRSVTAQSEREMRERVAARAFDRES
jgi:hypothetical protein